MLNSNNRGLNEGGNLGQRLLSFQSYLSKKEYCLLWFAVVLMLFGFLGPHIEQYAHYHDFADQNTYLGIPNAIDVLSNLPFALLGGIGVALVYRKEKEQSTFRDMSLLFFCGLIITTVCSSLYHLNPNDHTLWLDRAGMTVAFAGILGVAVGNRISERAAKVTAYTVLIAGPMSLWIWQNSGDLLMWSLLQGGGGLLILVLSFLPSIEKESRIPLLMVIVWYGLSKLCELTDQSIYQLTSGIVAGHSVKHIFAAFAALPLIGFLSKR